jgi:photosystem II stability/assembly factor-like uncharacterized protein
MPLAFLYDLPCRCRSFQGTMTLKNPSLCLLPIAMVAVLSSITAPASKAETLAELPQHTHYHGIAFNRSGTSVLLVATSVFAVDKDGTATRASPVQDFMGFSPDPANPLSCYASGHPASGGNSGFLHSADASWTQLSEGADGPVDFHQANSSNASAEFGSSERIHS